jgi:imidazole glycerol phosphate synthase glutamine amidotransferase subunit
VIAIIDYGAGNLSNVKNMLDYVGSGLEEGFESKITSSPEDVIAADAVVLPGVGAFGYLMDKLREKKLDKAIKKAISSGKPFLGVCLGLQALFEKSEESPGVKGLCILKGKVVKFKHGKVPHIGWNNVSVVRNLTPTTQIQKFEPGFAYFVHSFYPVPKEKEIYLFETDYYDKFCSGIRKGNIVGVQFHPERSGKWGITFYKQWLQTIEANNANNKLNKRGGING